MEKISKNYFKGEEITNLRDLLDSDKVGVSVYMVINGFGKIYPTYFALSMQARTLLNYRIYKIIKLK